MTVVPAVRPPSPKLQEKEYGATPPEAVAVNVAVCPICGARGDQDATGIGFAPLAMLKLSEKLPEKEVCTSILAADTVYLVKPNPLPGVFFPINLAKYGASATFAGVEAEAFTPYRSFIQAP